MTESRDAGSRTVAALDHLWKFYGSFAALQGVDFELRTGEVHILLGENGAGKSTLVGILTGTHLPDRGSMTVNGEAIPKYSPHRARLEGVNAVMQDSSLAPSLTVAENYFLGREETAFGLLSKAEMRRQAAEAIGRLGVAIDANARVADLDRAEQQVLEIVRALGGRPGALILDEPTASLSHDESERLFSIVDQLRAENWAILYITHRLEEVQRLGDRVTVLRDGRIAGVYDARSTPVEELVQAMAGRPLSTLYPAIPATPGGDALRLDKVSTADGELKEVSIEARFGEILGIGGLVGCGKAAVGRAAFGLLPVSAGEIEIEGARSTGLSCRDALARGLIYLPQDRRGEALALTRTVGENLSLEAVGRPAYSRFGFIRPDALRRLIEGLIKRLAVRPPNAKALVQELSGGNQQKVVLGRALSGERKIYVFDEPTAGVDVATRAEFYLHLRDLCDDGAAILLISSDLMELVHLSHRIYVMHAGRITAELSGADATEEAVVTYAFGGASAPAAAGLH